MALSKLINHYLDAHESKIKSEVGLEIGDYNTGLEMEEVLKSEIINGNKC